MNYNYPPPPVQQPQPYADTPINVIVEPAVAEPAPAAPQPAYYGASPMQPQPVPNAYYPPPPNANFIQAPVVTPDPNYSLPVAQPQPQQRIELDDEAKTFKKFVVSLIPVLIIDIFFGYCALIFSIFGIISGFVYCCEYQIGILGVYVAYRYICLVYLFFTLFAYGLTDYGWVVMVINLLLTAYATFIMTKANSVSKKYTAEQLKHLHYDSLLTNNLSINLHTYKLH